MKRPLLHRLFAAFGRIVACSCAPALAGFFATQATHAQGLAPRLPLETDRLVRPAELPAGVRAGQSRLRLVVKFSDQARVRSDDRGGLRSSVRALDDVEGLASGRGASFAPLLNLSEERLAQLERRASTRSGRAQPDLAGIFAIELPGTGAARLADFGNALRRQASVEFVHIQSLAPPPPGDIAPPTPDLKPEQDYFAPDPGLDADWAHAQGFTGSGVRLSDCEYAWNPDHEDLQDVDLHPEPGQTPDPTVYLNGWDDHGSAVLGSTSAPDNGYGVTGLCPGAQVYTYPEWSLEEGLRRASCIAVAVADSAPGDVVLLEMQAVGPGGGFAPAEVDPVIFCVVQTAVDAGVIVVAAAGNGNQDLDGPAYADYRSWGDSGALLVGAGDGTLVHGKQPFSTFGSRLDVQGWGTDVFTLGYGDFASYGNDENQSYTAIFNGTSSASGLVAAACALVQEAAVTSAGQRLSPRAMRQLLSATGRPQNDGGGNIGPLPDLRAAIEALPDLFVADFRATPTSGDAPLAVSFTDASFGVVTSRSWDFGDGTSATSADPVHVYGAPGLYDVSLTVSGPAGVATLSLPGYVSVDEALTVSSVDPAILPSLMPGTAQDVTVSGTDFADSAVVEVDGVALSPGSFLVIDESTITLDMPLLPTTGAHTLTVSSEGQQVDHPITVQAPSTPALQIGNGDTALANQIPSAAGVLVIDAGTPGETHWLLYSSQPTPSMLPGLISLDIGAAFSDLDLAGTQTIPSSSWAARVLPFAPTTAELYFQSITFDRGLPIPVSNLQSALLVP